MYRLTIPMLALMAFASSASATTVVVPDDYATVQQAEDSSADTVLVRGGFYPGPVVIDRPLVLMEYPDGALQYPTIGSVSVLQTSSGPSSQLLFRGLHIAGRVTLPSGVRTRYEPVEFESCRIDSGLFQFGYGVFAIVHLRVTRCTIMGGARLNSYYVDATLDSIIGGGLEVLAEGYATVRGNYVQGPAAVGILSLCDGHVVEDNIVTGVTDGIRVIKSPVLVRNNVVRDCSGHGYVRPDTDPMTAGTFTDNVALRCQGDGFRMEGTRFTGKLERNIAGRCGGHGISVSRGNYPWIQSNTLYLNGGSGIAVTPDAEGYSGANIFQNISFGNGAFGLDYLGGPPLVECNDWFGNAAGATNGVPPAASDLALDPQFCGLGADHVYLTSGSPLASADSCSLIGALGVGCPALTAVLDGSVETPGLAISPNPGSGAIHFAWKTLGQPARLEILDVQGRRRWSQALDAGMSSTSWDRRDASGHAVPPGIFYARLAIGGSRAVSRRFVMR